MSRSIFLKDTDVRWCPGCGDYAILKYLAETLEARGLKPEDVTVVSGIGCSSRLPYYLNTYGFHTLHGRALSIATGIALVQPDRPLIVITGDGDSCSIGLNHYLHTIKRNVNMTIILVNNHVYGLTKGQHSPTSLVGQKTKTMPQGVQEEPFSPLLLALAAGGSWLGRCFDVDHKLMKSLLNHALNHKGTSVLEVIQNCPIFDQDAYLSLKEHYRESYILWPNQKEEEDWNNGRYLYKDSSSQEWKITTPQEESYLYAKREHHDLWNLLNQEKIAIKGLVYFAERPVYKADIKIPSVTAESLYSTVWQKIQTWS